MNRIQTIFQNFYDPLPLWAFIVLCVVAFFILFWICLFFVTLIFSLHFKKHIQEDNNAINLLLVQRREVMLQFIKFAQANGATVPAEYIKGINRLERINDFQSLDKPQRDERVLTFIHSSHNILTVCEQNPIISQLQEYRDIFSEYGDIEEAYRQKVAIYNSDVIGYNYWVYMLSMRWLFKLMGFRRKDLIV